MEELMVKAKNRHGLRKSKYRGRSNVQIQAYLVSTVQNIKRIMSVLSDQPMTLYYQIKHPVLTYAPVVKTNKNMF